MSEPATSVLRRLVSGGQTGADRAALDAAMALGLAVGGWCPRGRAAEDGPIAEHYPLTETDASDSAVRTQQNVLDSDGTLIIAFGPLTGGSALTEQLAHRHRRPVLVIDANQVAPQAAAEQVNRFIQSCRVAVLNVAGPRASSQPAIYDYVRAVITQLLSPGPSDRA
jgi:hypothetical protein